MAVRVWAWRTQGWHQQGAKMGGHGVGETQVETVLDKNPTCTQWMSMLGQDNVGLAGISSHCKIPSKQGCVPCEKGIGMVVDIEDKDMSTKADHTKFRI